MTAAMALRLLAPNDLCGTSQVGLCIKPFVSSHLSMVVGLYIKSETMHIGSVNRDMSISWLCKPLTRLYRMVS